MILAALIIAAAPAAPAQVQQDIRAWLTANESCRGGEGASSARACTDRNALQLRLEAAGWCWAYNDVNVPPAAYAWHRCDQERPAPEARIIRAPKQSFTPNPFEIWVLLPIILAVYLLPTIIAAFRRHRNLPALAALNILAGWTFVGWAGSFVWSLLRDASRS